MPSLDDLKKRIKSVKSTQKITKAMKMVAAAKLRKAQESAEKGRPYSQKMQNIILNLTKSINDPQNAPKLLVGTGEDKKYLCVVLTADRGLCGGFNSNICKLAKNNFKDFVAKRHKGDAEGIDETSLLSPPRQPTKPNNSVILITQKCQRSSVT